MTDRPCDPYAVLGVARTATDGEISAAYRRLVRALHPDARRDGDLRKLDDVLAAYRLLRDPQRRAEHDRRHRVEESRRRVPIRVNVQTPPPVREPDLRAGPVRRHYGA